MGRPIVLISDEPYRKIVFDGLEAPSLFPFYEHTIVVTSHSKDLGLAAERVGYVALSPRIADAALLADALILANRILGFVNAPALMQHAVRSLQHITVDVSEYQRKRDFLFGHLTGIGYAVVKPQGAFYMFPQSPVEDEMVVVEALQRHGVLVVPGRGFGMPGYFRISYCVGQRVLEGALEGFRAVQG